MSENEVPPGSWLNNTRDVIKYGAIVGTTCYVCHIVYKSKKVHDVLDVVRKWGAEQNSKKYFNWFKSDECPLFDIPDSIRQLIFEYVPPSDLLALRLTCKRIQYDIDNEVGLYVYIGNYDHEMWAGTIVTQGIHIAYLQDCLQSESHALVSCPGQLKRLHINDTCSISSEIFVFILSSYPNLEDLNVHVRDDELVALGYCEVIHSLLLEKQQQLWYLGVWYQSDTQLCEWDMRFENAETANAQRRAGTYQYSDYQPTRIISMVLNFQHFQGIDGTNFLQTRLFWKRFLEKQTQLRRFSCNYGLVCWDVLAEVIEENAATFRGIQIQNVSNWEFWSAEEHREIQFDWNLFLKTKKLENLKLQFDGGQNLGRSQFQCIPVRIGEIMNLSWLYLDMGIVFWKFYQSIILANRETLQEVVILRVTASNRFSGLVYTESFDWTMFENCKNVVKLVVGGLEDGFLLHKNLTKLSSGILDFKLYYAMLTSEDCYHIALKMPNLAEAGYYFLDLCDVYGLDRRITPLAYIQAIQKEFEENTAATLRALEQCFLISLGLLATSLFWLL